MLAPIRKDFQELFENNLVGAQKPLKGLFDVLMSYYPEPLFAGYLPLSLTRYTDPITCANRKQLCQPDLSQLQRVLFKELTKGDLGDHLPPNCSRKLTLSVKELFKAQTDPFGLVDDSQSPTDGEVEPLFDGVISALEDKAGSGDGAVSEGDFQDSPAGKVRD